MSDDMREAEKLYLDWWKSLSTQQSYDVGMCDSFVAGYQAALQSLPRVTEAELSDFVNEVGSRNGDMSWASAQAVTKALAAKFPQIVKESV